MIAEFARNTVNLAIMISSLAFTGHIEPSNSGRAKHPRCVAVALVTILHGASFKKVTAEIITNSRHPAAPSAIDANLALVRMKITRQTGCQAPSAGQIVLVSAQSTPLAAVTVSACPRIDIVRSPSIHTRSQVSRLNSRQMRLA